MKQSPYNSPRRWLTIQGISHILHNKEGAWYAKLCGGVTTEGTVSKARPSDMENVCPECAKKLTQHIFVGKEELARGKKPLKTGRGPRPRAF